MMQLNSNQIAEIIPHRYPFALVDRIVDGEVGKWAKGIKCVTVNEPFFQGHFPQYHVMPGVLIIEALAQVGAVTMLSMPENKGKIGLFGGIKNARFRRQVTPGDVLELECTPACWNRNLKSCIPNSSFIFIRRSSSAFRTARPA